MGLPASGFCTESVLYMDTIMYPDFSELCHKDARCIIKMLNLRKFHVRRHDMFSYDWDGLSTFVSFICPKI